MQNLSKFALSALLLFVVQSAFAQLQNINLQLRSTMDFPGQTLANVCGYWQNGQEYAEKNYMRFFQTIYEAKMLWGLENKLDDGVPSWNSGSIESNTANTGQGSYVCTPDFVAHVIANNGADYAYCSVTIHYGETPEQSLTPK